MLHVWSLKLVGTRAALENNFADMFAAKFLVRLSAVAAPQTLSIS